LIHTDGVGIKNWIACGVALVEIFVCLNVLFVIIKVLLVLLNVLNVCLLGV